MDLERTKDRLAEVSPSFCLAKWTQVTLHLQNGHNHSCHHPGTHRADPVEVARNPAALHNTAHKKQRRQEMLNGQYPAECEYCWTVERSDPEAVSDRILKSASDWSASRYNDVLRAGARADIVPSYVEVSFSNVCNFKCSYCAPHISSKWMEEIRLHGAYPTSSRFNGLEHLDQQGALPIPEREDNPFVDAFWEWWPNLYPKLMDFRITGGEPLLSKHTFRMMEHILENPNPNFRFSINSNLCVPKPIYDRFLHLVNEIQRRKACGGFILYTSADTWGKQAEYIRHGMDYSEWVANTYRFLNEVDRSVASMMCTFNALSPFEFKRFYRDILDMRDSGRMGLNISHLVHPRHQHMWILPDWCANVIDDIAYTIVNHPKAQPGECGNITRIANLFRNRTWSADELALYRSDFRAFIHEHDRRRDTDFCTVFPELADFLMDRE